MENNVTQKINDLYLIRALLSKISQNSEMFDKLEIQRRKMQGQTSQQYCMEELGLQEEQEEIRQKKSAVGRMGSQLKRLNDRRTELEADIGKKERETAVEYSRGGWIFAAVCIAITACISFLLFMWWVSADFSFWIGLLAFPLTLLFIIWDIACVSTSTRKYHQNSRERSIKELEELRAKKEDVDREHYLTKQKIKELQSEVDSLEAHTKSTFEALAAQYPALQKERIDKLTNKQLEMIKDTTNAYDCIRSIAVLDERDWSNLDLIIYELETGRAESIKEALQQADLAIRHNEIKQLMQTATDAICKSIRSGMRDIRHAIDRQVEAQEKMVREMSGKFDAMLDAQELQNALLEKANVSSTQLAHDAARIRELKDWEYYGIK